MSIILLLVGSGLTKLLTLLIDYISWSIIPKDRSKIILEL